MESNNKTDIISIKSNNQNLNNNSSSSYNNKVIIRMERKYKLNIELIQLNQKVQLL